MNNVFSQIEMRGHEHVSYFHCPVTNLKAIVAIHNTVLGPSLGGCRVNLYEDESKALEDVLRLSEGMTYKNSIAGMDLGGGKACIIADSNFKEGREDLFIQFAKYINRLHGAYYTAKDMGTRVEDLGMVKQYSDYCVGFPIEDGGSGDPSPWTAKGVIRSFEAVSDNFLKKDISKLVVAVEGVGKVGFDVVKGLSERGATVYVTDFSDEVLSKAVNELGVKTVTLDEIYDVDCDVFSPCAIGQTVNSETLKRLECKAIIGAANNQLENSSIYSIINDKNILYCPDFVINAGGVISVGAELREGGWNKDWVSKKVDNIYNTITTVLNRSSEEGLFPEEIALKMAHERIEQKLNDKKER